MMERDARRAHGLEVVRSHVVERLFDGLADALDARRGTNATLDLSEDIVVVPSLALGRWLRERLARRNGVAMQIATPYLAESVLGLAMRAMPELSARSPFDPSVLAWHIYRVIDALEPGEPGFGALADYAQRTREDSDPIARMQLAERLARLFDRMAVYRPEWLQAWYRKRFALSDGPLREIERWQIRLAGSIFGALGSRFTAETVARHPVDLFADRLLAGDLPTVAVLPARLDVFALPSVPPLYWRALRAIAAHRPVTVHQVAPTGQYVVDLATPRAKALAAIDNPAAADLLDVGHPLLALWGRQAADLVTGTQDDGEVDLGGEDEAGFAIDRETTLLDRLQASIVAGEPPRRGEWAGLEGDRSIRVVSAASLERQMEALHDELLRRFEADPTLRPADVAVLLPDIDAAAPAIEAVFGGAPRARAIAWRISGRRATLGQDSLAAALLALIDVIDSRAPFSRVAALLRHPACRRRFGVDAPSSDDILERLAEAGARWGWDAAHRVELGLPAESRHSWLQAVDALVLDYARGAPDDPTERDGIAGSRLEPASATLAALATIQWLRSAWRKARSMDMWARSFERGFEAMFEPDPADADEADRVRSACAQLAADCQAADAGDLVLDRRLARRQLEAALEQQSAGATATGAVTFAGIAALRTLPFRILVLAGLDDHAWPRRLPREEFDLMTRAPKPGDPSRRVEDRGAMLDAVMSARDALILAYQGRDPRDGRALPPALVLEELLDVLRTGCGTDAVKQTLVREAALHGFSPAAFDAAQPSFAAEYWDAARTIASHAALRDDDFATAARIDRERWNAIGDQRLTIVDLVSFLSNPLRWYQRRGLRLETWLDDDRAIDDEPVGGLSDDAIVKLGARIGRAMRAGASAAQAESDVSIDLPHGAGAAVELARARDSARRWTERMSQIDAAAGPALEALDVDWVLDTAWGPMSLAGRLQAHANAVVLLHAGKRSMRARAMAWVHWLVEAAEVERSDHARRERPVIVACDDGRVFVDRGEWAGSAVEALARLMLDASAGAISPVGVEPKSAWALALDPHDTAWRRTWTLEFDKPHAPMAAFFPNARRHPPDSLGVDGPLSYEHWAARLYGAAARCLHESEQHKAMVKRIAAIGSTTRCA